MAAGLMEMFGAAGLAGASGHRAFIPAFALGAMHRIAAMNPGANGPFFELSESFLWLADPIVMTILGVLTVVEILAEMNPDAPELVNLSMKLPKLASGFIVVAAATGQMTESSTLMVASGVLGAGTALTVDQLRASVKHTVDDAASDATDGWSTRLIGGGESLWAAGLSVAAVVMPIVAAAGVLLLVGLWWGARRAAKAKYVPCPQCKAPHHPAAVACPNCQAALTSDAPPAQPTPAVVTAATADA